MILTQALKLLNKEAIQNWLTTNHPTSKIGADKIISNEVNWLKEFVRYSDAEPPTTDPFARADRVKQPEVQRRGDAAGHRHAVLV